jgi:hypothetical protein
VPNRFSTKIQAPRSFARWIALLALAEIKAPFLGQMQSPQSPGASIAHVLQA